MHSSSNSRTTKIRVVSHRQGPRSAHRNGGASHGVGADHGFVDHTAFKASSSAARDPLPSDRVAIGWPGAATEDFAP
jgi:hypothetical protein